MSDVTLKLELNQFLTEQIEKFGRKVKLLESSYGSSYDLIQSILNTLEIKGDNNAIVNFWRDRFKELPNPYALCITTKPNEKAG